MNRQLTKSREEVCDNHVLQFDDRFSYARTLLALTESCRPVGEARPGLEMSGTRWSLADRVAGMLDTRRVSMTQPTVRVRIALAVAVTVAGLTVSLCRLDRPAHAEILVAEKTVLDAKARPDSSAEGWQVKGTVVDERGHPVTGASVHSVPNDGVADEARTLMDGSFALALADHRPFIRGVVAEIEGRTRIGLVRFEGARNLGVNDPVKIVLKPSQPVPVRVKDAGGAPVAGAAVEAIDFSFQFQSTANPQGLALLRIPADSQIQWVIGLKSGAGIDYFENYRTKPATDFPPLPNEVTLTLDDAQTIRLRALDSPGSASSRCHVLALASREERQDRQGEPRSKHRLEGHDRSWRNGRL